MNRSTLIAGLVAVAVLVGAWLVAERRAPETEVASSALYPGLIERINDVTTLAIRQGGSSVTLAVEDGGWTVAEFDGYPALAGRVRQLALTVAELGIVEAKTADPARYGRIGVSDPGPGNDDARAITLKNAAGEALAALIVGNRRESSVASAPQYYVRRAGQAQSFLVEGDLGADADPLRWIRSDIVDVPAARVRSVTITHADGETVRLKRPERGADMLLLGMPEGARPTSKAALSSLAAMLSNVRVDGAAAAAQMTDAAAASTVELRTFDGLVASVSRYAANGEDWFGFSFRFDAAAVVAPAPEAPEPSPPAMAPPEPVDDQALAEALNARVNGWVYQLPEFKRSMLAKRLATLITTEAEAPPPGGAASD